MTAPRYAPLLKQPAYTDDSDCCADENAVLYHVAVAPDCRLDVQRRIANAVYPLPRPISERAFKDAALAAEDAYWGIGNPWPPSQVELFIEVANRMFDVIRHTQLVCP